jgi:pyruvate/2-oxoglutarate/acetoin dehydrogenase E1 component/TPP-dependent pyruvate/acetoin dehydrogenase alpha subunit
MTAASARDSSVEPEPAAMLDAYGRMKLIREFEQGIHRLFLQGEVHGTTHLSAGQEAIPVGVCMALEPDDYVSGTYRGHGHALAKGTDPEALAAEMLGRATGVCGGRAGSMNVVDLERGLVGCFGIVGGSIAAATGAALSGKRQGRVSVAFFGDGAANQAYFHECLNFAQVLELPAIFVCENNLYGEFTPMRQVTAGGEIAVRAGAYGIPFAVVDGNDLWAVREAAVEAVGRAREGGGPTLLECRTYRHFGHSKSDPAKYRPADEVERWLERDPLTVARERLLADGHSEEEIADTEQETLDRIEAAMEAARAAEFPNPGDQRASEYRSAPGALTGTVVAPDREAGDGTGELEFRVAIRDAIAEELERDPAVIFLGEDVAAPGGVFAVTTGLHERFGPERVFDTPISELALAGAAFGAAATGLRPVIEIMFGDFMGLPMDSLVNQAAKLWYVSNEQGSAPLVVRSAVGAGGRFGAMHSQIHGSWFQGIPGLKIVAPSSPADAKGLLKSAIRDDNPVIFLEHKRLYSVKGPRPEEETIPIGRAAVVREGNDLTIVAVSKGVRDALEAAEALAADGLQVEVVDLRTLRPLDAATVLESVSKTNRVLAVEEGPRTGGWASGVLGVIAEQGLHELDDAWIIATDETPVPYSPTLEDAFLPGAETIVESVRGRLDTGSGAPR